MAMDGWIKLHRKLLYSRAWLSADAEGKVILITLLLRASHAPTQWKITVSKTATLNPGQLFITFRTFAATCGVSTKKLISELKRLEEQDFLTLTTNKDGTIVSLLNWFSYQNTASVETPLDTTSETPKGTPQNIDKDRGLTQNTVSAETPLGTALETLSKTPQNTDDYRVSTQNTISAETPLGTALETLSETHNKIYILIKNKYNKTELNDKLLTNAETDDDYRRAIEIYNQLFPDKANQFSHYDALTLKIIAVLAGGNWILRAVYELKAISKETKLNKPAKYMLGILQNWLLSGLPNDSKGQEQSLKDFYKQEAGIKWN